MPVINPIAKKDSPKLAVTKKKTSVPAETNPEKIAGYLREYAPVLEATASKYDIPRSLLVAVMITESGGRPDAESPTGCKGVMQLSKSISGTNHYGPAINPFDPATAIDRAGAFLRDLNKKYKGDLGKVLVGYNQGEPYVNQAVDASYAHGGKWTDHLGPKGQQEAQYYLKAVGNILSLSDSRVNSEVSGYLSGGKQMVAQNHIRVSSAVSVGEPYAQAV